MRRCAVDTDTSCAAATSSSVSPSIVRATKSDRSLPPSLSSSRVVARDRLAPVQIGGVRPRLGKLAGRRQRQPAPAAAARDLAAHDVDADAGQEPAHRGRLAQRADAAEEADEHLLQQVLAIGPGPEQAAQRLIDARREPIPGGQLRARIAARATPRPARRPNRRRALGPAGLGMSLAPSLISNCARIGSETGQEKAPRRGAAQSLSITRS